MPFWLYSSRVYLASPLIEGNCAAATTPRWKRLSASRTVAVCTSRLAAATCCSRLVRTGSRNTRHQVGSVGAGSCASATARALIAGERHFRQMRIGLNEIGTDGAACDQREQADAGQHGSERSRRSSMGPARSAAADLGRQQETEGHHDKGDDGAIIKHVGIGQNRHLSPERLIDAPDGDVVRRSAGPPHRAQGTVRRSRSGPDRAG